MRAALLELIVPSVCPGCDEPRAEGRPLLCAACAAALVLLPGLRAAHTAIAYEGKGAELLRRFKFEHRRDALRVLLDFLVERVRGQQFEGVVPVPRHPGRVRELGVDPTFELGRDLARRTGQPLWDGVLGRSRPPPTQTGLGPADRRRNVRGSFRARRAALRGRSVLLLDDVTTTGATLDEAAVTLREEAGARRVLRVALAGTIAL